MIQIFEIIILVLLIVCAVAACFIKDNLTSIIVFMSYSTMMSIIWIILQAPDLAITEAAVGAGITSVLFFLTLKRINQIDTSLNSVEDNLSRKDTPAEGKEEDTHGQV